ncbi:hypothetical protein JMUB6875_67570 [Nocardia sp. JMUB6875]
MAVVPPHAVAVAHSNAAVTIRSMVEPFIAATLRGDNGFEMISAKPGRHPRAGRNSDAQRRLVEVGV